MQAGSKLPDISKKETLREKLHTANNMIKQLQHENKQLKNPWISVDDDLPDVDMGYFIVACDSGNVDKSFFIADRENARKHHSCDGKHGGYSRKYSNKASCHFDIAHTFGYKITHWIPLPLPPAL